MIRFCVKCLNYNALFMCLIGFFGRFSCGCLIFDLPKMEKLTDAPKQQQKRSPNLFFSVRSGMVIQNDVFLFCNYS